VRGVRRVQGVRGAKGAKGAQGAALSSDQDTRERLLTEAARLFAARGFARVTVRDICRAANANVAAVNYHFQGKRGLYDAVVRMAIERMQQTTEAAQEAGRGMPASGQLASYVSVFLQRVIPHRDGWIHQLMVRELAEPTPALQLVVREVLEPRARYLTRIVASIMQLRTDDLRVQRAVVSVNSQCFAAIDSRLPVSAFSPTTPAGVDDLADHIASFSLGGIQRLTSSPRATRGTRPARRARLPRRP